MREKTLQEVREEQKQTSVMGRKPRKKDCPFHIYTRWDEEFRVQLKISEKWRLCKRSPTLQEAQKWVEKDKRSRQFWFSNGESEYVIIDSRIDKSPNEEGATNEQQL